MKRSFMKRLFEELEALMAAAAFAEEGEVETARRLMGEAGADEPAERPEARRPLRPWARGAPRPKSSGA